MDPAAGMYNAPSQKEIHVTVYGGVYSGQLKEIGHKIDATVHSSSRLLVKGVRATLTRALRAGEKR